MENIMMDKQRENVKIIDFGLSNQCGPEELFKTHCGSPEYAAPELYVAGRDYGPEVDIWSLGVIMFAMVTGKLPFTTPHSENRRQHLLLQIKKGLKGVHDKEMAHLTDDCKDMLHGCIEPTPEDRLPLLDIERHAWITCEGQEPFCPFQTPPQDLDLRAEVIEDMALRLKVKPDKIQDVVLENKLDDVSAIFNILMEEHLIKRGVWTGDHTRPPTPQTPTPTDRARSRTGTREGSRASSARPGSAYAGSSDGVRTPTVVTMVRPSLKSPDRKNKKIIDFELDVVEEEQTSWAQRTGLPPTWAKRSRPLGNATTANRVKAQASYRMSTPGTGLSTPDQEYVHAHTDLLDASTDHILVPTPSFESLPTSQADLDDSKSPSVPWAKPHSKGRVRSGPKPRGGCMKQKTFKPISNVRVSFCGSTLEKERTRALKEKKIPCTDDGTNDRAQDVNVVDMSKNFAGKHHNYHGYHLYGTPITTEGEASETVDCTKTAESGKDKIKEVRLCVAHREFLQDGGRSSGGRPAATPYSTPRTHDNDNELVLTTKLYPPTPEADEHTTQSDDASTPKAIAGRFNSTSKKKKKERCRVNSASTTSSITFPSPRSLLHPSIASIHGKKENKSMLSNFAVLRCSDNKGGTFGKLPQNGAPVKRNGQNKKKGEKERKNAACKSPESPVCRRTTVELTDREVRGQKFKMYDEMPQRALQKRLIRRSPEHSARQSANIQNRGYRSARVNAPNFQADDAPSKFIQKFGANRLSQNNKDGHQHCRMPTYGYAKDNFLVSGHPPCHSRIQSAETTSKITSPLRRVVDITEQAMNSLVNEAIREKKTNRHVSGGDIVKSIQRHFSDLRKSQKRSPGYEMYTRFIPVQISEVTGNEMGMIRPSSSPVPRLNVPKEPVFNIKETLPVPPHPYLTPPPPSSASAPPPVDKAESPRGAGRAVMATGITKRNAVSATDASGATPGGAEEWDATYRLERKVSATLKGAAYVRNMKNDQRTRAWVADLAADFAPNNVSEQ